VNIELQNQSDLSATILVKLGAEDYAPKVESQLKKIQKTANIKGFRVGHAPMGMLKRNYGKSVLVDEVNNMASQSLSDYLKDQNMDILAQPMPSVDVKSDLDFEKENADYTYAFDVALAPSFDLNINTKDEAMRYTIDVDDAEVKKEIENLRKRNGTMVAVDVSEENDIVYANATELDENGATFEGGLVDKPISFVAEMVKDDKTKKAVIGIKAGDVVKVNIFQLFNENITAINNTLGISKEEANDLNADFSLTITEVKRNEYAELNQAFFDTIFGPEQVKTEEEFEAKIRENLEIYFKSEAENQLEHMLNHLISEKHNIKLPDAFLKRWLIETKSEEYNADNIDERYSKEAEGLVYVLVQEKMAKEYNFEVGKEDLEQTSLGYVAQMFRQYGISNPEFSMIKEYSDKQLKDPNYIQTVMDIALRRKMIEKIKELVTIKEKKINVEDFYKEINAHKHEH